MTGLGVAACRSWIVLHVLLNRQVFLFALEQLSECLNVGIDLTQSVRLLAKRSSGKKQTVFLEIQQQVENGLPIADVLGRYVDATSASMLRMSEHVGVLDVAIREYVRRERQRNQRREGWIRSLSYPFGLLLGCAGLVLFVRFQVQPELFALRNSFQSVTSSDTWLQTVAIGLPLWIFVLFFALPGGYAVICLMRRYTGHRVVALPFDRLRSEYETEHFVYCLSVQLSAGLSLMDALQVGTESSKKRTKPLFEYTRSSILSGNTLSDSLHPRLLANLKDIVQLGEITGEVARALNQAQTMLEESIHRQMDRLTRYLEPIFMGVMGLVVLSTMYSVFAPMYAAVSSASSVM